MEKIKTLVKPAISLVTLLILVKLCSLIIPTKDIVDIVVSDITETLLLAITFIALTIFFFIWLFKYKKNIELANVFVSLLKYTAYLNLAIGAILGSVITLYAIEIDAGSITHLSARILVALIGSMLPAFLLWRLKSFKLALPEEMSAARSLTILALAAIAWVYSGYEIVLYISA